ncbi:L-lactate permease [Streptomyces sp. NPDC054950]
MPELQPVADSLDLSALVANTAPVAFGAMGTPGDAGPGHRPPTGHHGLGDGPSGTLLALVVPLVLVGLVDGRRGLRETWVPALASGIAFAVASFAAAGYTCAQLADIGAALAGAAALAAVPHARVPAPEAVRAPVLTGTRSEELAEPDPRAEVVRAYTPYALVVVIFSVAQIPAVKDRLAQTTRAYDWSSVDVVDPDGNPAGGNLFAWPVVATGGTLVLLAGIGTAAVLGVHARVALRERAATVNELRYAILTVTSVLALAHVMNLSGQAATIGHFVAAAGAGLALLSPVPGWFGVAVSGSDTSADALFGALQVTAARESGLSPELPAAANSSGGVLGKMISPQNLTIACAAAVGLAGREGDLPRKVLPWSLGLLLVMCLIAVGQSSPVPDRMLP